MKAGLINKLFLLTTLIFACCTTKTFGQLPEEEYKSIATYSNFKILEEHPDGKGFVERTIEYTQGSMRVTETIILPQTRVATAVNKIPIEKAISKVEAKKDSHSGTTNNHFAFDKDSVMVVINKSHYNLEVFYKRKLIRSYKAVFGPQPLMNKCMEGDRCTPEGWFQINDKHVSNKYNKFLGINYPNESTIARFNDMKKEGKLPQTARPGGNVGIHGIWKGGDDMIELGVGWTDGCIALKNEDVEELFSLVVIGTKVFIRK